MWLRKAMAPVWRCPKCGVTACSRLQRQELLFSERTSIYKKGAYWSLFLKPLFCQRFAERSCYFLPSQLHTYQPPNICLTTSLQEWPKIIVKCASWHTIEEEEEECESSVWLMWASARLCFAVCSKIFPVALCVLCFFTCLSAQWRVMSSRMRNRCAWSAQITPLPLLTRPPHPKLCEPVFYDKGDEERSLSWENTEGEWMKPENKPCMTAEFVVRSVSIR